MRTVFATVLFLPVWALAQERAHALLWRITGPEGAAPSYVLGTVHSRDARAYTAIELALAAMEACPAMYGEVDLEAAKSMASSHLAGMMIPGGKSLKELYPNGRYKRVEKALRAKVGPMFMMFTHMKPILLSAMITDEDMGQDSSRMLDDYLQVRAKELGRQTGGIESMAEQFAAIDAIPLAEQADMLYETVRETGRAKEMDRLLDAYAAQDLGAMATFVQDEHLSEAFSRSLVGQRNEVMAQRIDSLMKLRPALFAVGAAHLPGPGGLLTLLEGKGLKVEPVLDKETIGPPLGDPPGIGIDVPPPPTDEELQRIEAMPRGPEPPIIPK